MTAEPKPKLPRVDYEQLLADQILAAGLPMPERQKSIKLRRRWRVDFAWPDYGLLLEVHGKSWRPHGRDVRSDMEKSNEAQLLGWTFLQVPTDHVTDGQAIVLLRRVLETER